MTKNLMRFLLSFFTALVFLLPCHPSFGADTPKDHLSTVYIPFFPGMQNVISTKDAEEILNQLEYRLSTDKKVLFLVMDVADRLILRQNSLI